MALESMEDHIREGVRNAKANPTEFGVTFDGHPIRHKSVGKHPNYGMALPEMKHFSGVRQTMNRALGEDGLITITVQAVDSPTACRLISEECARINEPFIRRERKNAKQRD